MNKKGFSYFELSVIIITILIMAIIFFFNMQNIYTKFKDRAFRTDAREVLKVAEQKLLSDKMFTSGLAKNVVYSKTLAEDCQRSLPLDKKSFDKLEYYIEFDREGKTVKFYVTNGLYQFGSEKHGLTVSDITDVQLLSKTKKDDKFKIYCETVDKGIENCVDMLETTKGSFSRSEKLQSICTELVDDGYVYTELKYDDSWEEKKKDSDILVARLIFINKNASAIIYDTTDRKKELANIQNDKLPVSRYSVKNGLVMSGNTIEVPLGKYNKDGIRVDVTGGVEYELFYVDKYTEVKYEGPWVTNQQTINKIKNLFSVGLKGFTNCNSKNKCTGHKYTAVFEDGKNNK